MKILLSCSLALLLPACAAYPTLVSVQPPPPAADSRTQDVDSALARASSLQTEYSLGYRQSGQLRDFSQLPIIGVAAAAAWILLDNHPNAARRTGRIGILAGAYSEGRNQLIAGNMTDVYIAGHGALTCVMAQGSYFSGQGAADRVKRMDDSLTRLTTAVRMLGTAMAQQPDQASADERALLTTTKAAADLALTQARTAASTALSERMAYEGAGPVFWLALSSISTRVASRGRQRPAADYRALVTQFSPPATGTQGHGNSTLTVAEIMRSLIDRTQALIDATVDLRGVTPNYNERLKLVSECPKDAG